MSVATTLAERKAITGSPKVCGILSIIFASIVLLGGLAGTCGGFAASSMTNMSLEVGGAKFDLDGSGLDRKLQVELFNLVKEHIGGLYTAVGIISLAFAVMSAWLLAIGIGQIGYRRWARSQSVTWGVLGLVVLVGVTVFSMLVIGPSYQGLLDELAKHAGELRDMPVKMQFGSLGTIAGLGSALVSIVVFAPYPIILISIFRGERCKQAMTA